jgi:transglutaminase-like putative cysteine protease
MDSYYYSKETDMRTAIKSTLVCVLLVAVLATIAPAREKVAEFTYAVEINGVVCGYADLTVWDVETDGEQYLEVKHHVFTMLTLLGAEVNSKVYATYHVDPKTQRATWFESRVDNGEFVLESEVTVEGGTATCYTSLTGEVTHVAIADDVIVENSVYAYHILRDFVDGGATAKTYDVFSATDFAIQENTCTKVGSETLTLVGAEYETIIVNTVNKATGTSLRSWVNVEDGATVKVEFAKDRVAYLADPSIKKKIELVNADELITVKTNVAIADVQAISYMKVRARIKPTGLRLEPERLNVPGQIFEGTVEENLVEGIFEIEHARYDGTDAPPYPAAFGDDQSLAPYLEPSALVQSDDPVLSAKAIELADGSTDSWEAACRLSRWVAENIGYAIPGGGAPRNVYDLRAGECGGHSFLLASFCRAVGIPARVVWGCMYTPNFGGSFGQHAWNEIYMGNAGWIPVDATAMEVDFVDSGHIRVGEYESLTTALNAEDIVILDHRGAAPGTVEEAAAAFEKYEPYLGDYKHRRGAKVFKVLVENGSLAVSIPNQVVIAFNDPDEDGKWSCKMSNAVYCTFTRNWRGNVKEMVFHEVVQMPRRSDPKEIDSEVPEELRPYFGGYYMAALQAEFVVSGNKWRLTIYDPTKDETIPLKEGDTEGTWIDRNNQFTISFVTGEDGKVSMLLLDAANRFRKK